MIKSAPHAVIDIGSNSVRMAVYERGCLALPLFNEKASCALGKDLGKTGQLYAQGVHDAILLLQRFAALSRNMGVKKITVVATAAVRTASNGKKFVRDVQRQTGLRIRVIAGKEEAQLSAMGVIAAFPDASGIMGDMGGGSMELVSLRHSRILNRTSLPHGPLSLSDLDLSLDKIAKKVREDYKKEPWLAKSGKQKTFYAVGGVFRAMARLHMEIHDYPLHVVHHYTIDRQNFMRFLRKCQSGDWNRQAAKAGIAKNRIDALPYAATVLLALFSRVSFERVCFSGFGLREGIAFTQDRKLYKGTSVLLNTCKSLAIRNNRFALNGDEVFDFLKPMMKDLDKKLHPLFRAACWISDIGWADHPEQRAMQILHRILHTPLLAIDHPGRVFIAVCCYARYAGKAGKLPDLIKILDRKNVQQAMRMGAALRFADTLCGGAPHVLQHVEFRVSPRQISLILPRSMPAAGGEEVGKRFEILAEVLKKRSMIVQNKQ